MIYVNTLGTGVSGSTSVSSRARARSKAIDRKSTLPLASCDRAR
jgi:hypothetical protein